MRVIKLFVLIASVAIPSFAMTDLKGHVSGILDSSGNPYIVHENISVDGQKTLVIKAGCLLLFKPFSGLVINNGNLLVEGTLLNPVIFTSINDSSRYATENPGEGPQPFDWNGILVAREAGDVRLSNFILEYSVYGLKSQKESFTISNGTFKENGQFHFSVNGLVKPVIEGQPFKFGLQQDSINSANSKTFSSRKQPRSIFLGTASSVVAAAGLIGTIAYYLQYDTFHQDASKSGVLTVIQQNEKDQNGAIWLSSISGGLFALGTTGAIYFFKSRDSRPAKHSAITIEPDFSYDNAGISISISLSGKR